MAGKTLEEARAAQRAYIDEEKKRWNTRPGHTTQASAHVAVQPQPTPVNVAAPSSAPSMSDANKIVVNSQTFFLTLAPPDQPAPAKTVSVAITLPPYNKEEYYTALATTYDVALGAPLDGQFISPFILDTGATCHMSHVRSDFISLEPIAQHPVKGIGGHAVHAVGVGDIVLTLPNGHILRLNRILHAPNAGMRLISVRALNKSGNYTSHFDTDSCWITDANHVEILCGTVSPLLGLYMLPPPSPEATLIATARTPNITTWHRHLGHCNVHTIVEMAKNKVLEGMHIDMSLLPPTCDYCALGKQSHSTVPKTREGGKVEHHLGRVYVDLSGPMSTMSHASNLYAMDLIDDFSNSSLQPTVPLDDDPSWAEALASPECEYWIAGGREELQSLSDLNVFVLVPRSTMPPGTRPLRGKLVCKRKRDDSGKVVRYKVRYVAKGYAQRWGIDYDKTTAPTVRLESFRSILHIGAALNWDI